MYRVRLECPQDSTNRSRPSQCGVRGVVPQDPLEQQVGGRRQAHRRARVPEPAFCTASMASTRIKSTARASAGVHSSSLFG